MLRCRGGAWFCLGMCASAFRCEERRVPVLVIVICALSAVVCIIWQWIVVYPFFSIVAVWGAFDMVLRKLPQRLPTWMSMSFWIYCCHGPVSGWVNAVFNAVFGNMVFGYCFTIPTMVFANVCICLLLAIVCKKASLRAYQFLSGGRG